MGGFFDFLRRSLGWLAGFPARAGSPRRIALPASRTASLSLPASRTPSVALPASRRARIALPASAED